ncbi:hypothetical protein acdb102_12690 [Acidothermaceae bacterium B102]|nr:hypothetical protein acdb102_12690 [Acidothermaceae bacterium B102]
MSWAAHELESYFLQKHTKIRVSYLAILLGCLAPDFTKFHVYGLDIGPIHLKAAKHPYEYHRGWPGVGPTHSLMFGVALFVFVLLVFRSKQWALGLLIGQWAHVLTDICDSVGTMVFFPFSTQHYTIGMWAYAAQQGKYGDAAAYYSSLGGVWDFFWLLMVLTGFQVLSAGYFFAHVVPNDPVWGWLRRRFHLRDVTLLAMYRAFFLYGACRIIAWFTWSRLVRHAPLDWSWGGPYWVNKVVLPHEPWATFAWNTTRSLVLFPLSLYLLWVLFGRRLWNRGQELPALL